MEHSQPKAMKSESDLSDIVDPRIEEDEISESISDDLTRTTSNREIPQESLEKDPLDHIYVEFTHDDPRNPFNFSRARKWAITLTACAVTGISASASSSIASGDTSMQRDLSATHLQVALSVSTYALGFALVPLVTAPLSEEFGRQPLYIVSGTIFMLMHVALALAPNIQAVIVFRCIQGCVGATGATVVGGSVADLWKPHERGLPMSVFSLAAIGATGLGPVLGGLIEQNPHLQWRWIQWIHVIFAGLSLLSVIFIMGETRGGVLLKREARRLRKTTGDSRYRARVEDEKVSLRTMIYYSATRPLYLLFTEPVVASVSLWIGFAWGIVYGQIESIGFVFRTLYGFNDAQAGLCFLPMSLGALIGFLLNFYQDKLYTKHVHRRGPEARLFLACAAGAFFPIGCLIYAWTSFSFVPWIGPCIGLTVFTVAVFTIYLSVFSYLADCYLIYASSALAAQSLCRNLAAVAFPLFTDQMYTRLTFPWASTLLGCIAWLMAPIPLVLFFWGPQLRARSRFASRLREMQGK
ncbi:MFS general substrate transporter [Sistotremastrum niveocremeum HHB9708]|uniref:MFS general substrate transporter n=1 Tax=Sistotremastrum niveocremeum HHB9708 TaxID=1314777 RepID=A0A164VT57_9AGAM|nr:MFS general substrate transporter [Sistotremastrum niveocremeum HHB9708]